MKEEIYTPGHGDAAICFIRRRSLASHGAFAAPLFQPDQRILDLGSGPGTILPDLGWRRRARIQVGLHYNKKAR